MNLSTFSYLAIGLVRTKWVKIFTQIFPFQDSVLFMPELGNRAPCWYLMAFFVFLRESNSWKNNPWKATYDKYKLLTSMRTTSQTFMTHVSTLRVYHSFNNKQSQPSQKLSQSSRPANILTSLLSANSYFTYLSSPNFLLFHSVLSISINGQRKLWPQDKYNSDTDSQEGKKEGESL